MINIYLLIKRETCSVSGLEQDVVIYVGQTKNIKRRLSQHKNKQFDKHVIVYETDDLEDAKKAENFYIMKYDPIYNKSLNFIGHYGTLEYLANSTNMHGFELSLKDICEIMHVSIKNDLKPLFNDKYSCMDFYKVVKAWHYNKISGGFISDKIK